MATLLEEFAQLLDQLDLGTYTGDQPGGDIYLTLMPPTPDTVLVLALYAGDESGLEDDYDEPRLQVRARGPDTDARVAEQKAQAVYDRLHGLGSQLLPGGTWLQLVVGLQSGPIFIGQDANGRPEYTVNFRAEVSRTT